MPEYIKRYKAMQICEMHSQNCFNSCNSKGQDVADLILDDIVTIPTADVVEVTYCKDCKLRDTEGCPLTYWNGGELVSNVEDTDFCSYGERKDGV